MILRNAAGLAEFQPDKMGKVHLAGCDFLYAGLNCFEPRQEHKAHVHEDQDKLYVVLVGEGEVTVGPDTSSVSAGDVVVARAGETHGIRNTSAGRLVTLVVFGPPPRPKA